MNYQRSLFALLGVETVYLLITPFFNASPPAVIVPYLIPKGWILYETIIIQYPPGYLWLTLALGTLIPDVILRLRVANVLLAWWLILLSWVVGKRYFGERTAIRAAWFGGIWYMPIGAMAFYLDTVVGVLALTAFWQLKRPIIAGVLLSCALLIKPQALLFAFLFGTYYLWSNTPWGSRFHL